jgi:hypothetical protein
MLREERAEKRKATNKRQGFVDDVDPSLCSPMYSAILKKCSGLLLLRQLESN